MRVPVLALDSENITEVIAVATAISSLASDKHLMGWTPLDNARVYEWMSYLSGTLHGAGFAHLFRPQRWTDDPEAFESIQAKARECVKDCFDLIEGRLDRI
jgi:glutathione S-transferase